MADVRLSDIIDVTVFNDLPAVNSPEKTAFFESGVVQRNQLLDRLAGQPGSVAELPFWKDLDPSVSPNLSTDDSTSEATPQKISQAKQIAYKSHLNQGWSEMDLAAELAMGGRAMERIRSRVDAYWTRQWQRRLIQASLGVLADSQNNYDGDMVETRTNPFDRAAFVAAVGTLGDNRDQVAAIAVHSSVRDQMDLNDGIEYIRDSEGNLIGEAFAGYRLIVDDGMPVRDDGSGNMIYTSVIFGAGAFGWGAASPVQPTEVDRNPRAGDGAGQEELWSRRTWLLHPFGYQAASPSAQSHTLSELSTGTTWTRVIDRKSVPLAFLETQNDGA